MKRATLGTNPTQPELDQTRPRPKLSSIDERGGLTRVLDRARTAEAAPFPRLFRPEPFPTYPDEVCVAIRMIQTARTDAERPLSAAHRQMLARAMDAIAEVADMQAQVDAVAGKLD